MKLPMDSWGSRFLPWAFSLSLSLSLDVRGEAAAAAAEKTCFHGPIREGMKSAGKGIW